MAALYGPRERQGMPCRLPHPDTRGMAYACRCFAMMALHPPHHLPPHRGQAGGAAGPPRARMQLRGGTRPSAARGVEVPGRAVPPLQYGAGATGPDVAPQDRLPGVREVWKCERKFFRLQCVEEEALRMGCLHPYTLACICMCRK